MAFINKSTFHVNVYPFVAPLYMSFIFYFLDNTNTTHFYTYFVTIVLRCRLWMVKEKNGDPCDSSE